MSERSSATHAFERSHDILIAAAPDAVLDYVSNPNSWPHWLAASHRIDSPDRPLVAGDRFREDWVTRTGPAELRWRVTERAPGRSWTAETATPFLGPIVIHYRVDAEAGGTRFTRTLRNPARPKPPSPAMIDALDAESTEALANIKRNVEAAAGHG